VDDIYDVIIGGVIGIAGTLLGAFLTHWLDLRKEHIRREMDARRDIRSKLLDGASSASERHGRTRVPFDGGASLYFPTKKYTPEAILRRIQVAIAEIDDQGRQSRIRDVLQSFLESFQGYLRSETKD